MKRHLFITRLASLAVVCGLTLAFASCANDDLAQNGKTTTDDKGLTAFSTGEPTTRTTMEADGKFYWEAGDKIWVKDDSGNWKQSSNSPTGKTASFKFLMPGKYTAKSSYEVYYPGKNGNKDKVTISANQTQTEPNTTTHFGASGDCGIAKATRNATTHEFEFALDHKAAYLVFQPYTSNTILNKCYLMKIEVTSDNDITSTSTYTLDPTADTGAGALTGTGNGKQIVLETKGSGAYANGFPLTNTSASLTTNGAYMVIKPGTHTLRIRYWVRDKDTGIQGTITKLIPSHTFAKNEYVNMEANLQIKNYDGDHYYMWDAQDQYWKGHEWNKGGSQPILGMPGFSHDYPTNGDSRYYNTYFPGNGISNPATHTSFNGVPNVNEMTWYAKGGDPHWDADEIWAAMGHLQKGGMWLKKKSKISGFSTNKAVDGTDWRVGAKSLSVPVSNTPLSAADASNYFYLPNMGYYGGAVMYGSAYYWSSSAYPWITSAAYLLNLTESTIEVRYEDARTGAIARPFSDFGDN